MKSESIVAVKSFAFALRAYKAGDYLIRKKSEFILSKQLIRSAMSIGANLEEALGGQSRADFHARITIAYKEARESVYWVRLMIATHLLTAEQGSSLLHDARELVRILGSIQLSTRPIRTPRIPPKTHNS